MKQQIDNLLFTELTDIPPIDKDEAVFEINKIVDQYAYEDTFRTCKILPLYTKRNHVGLVTSPELHTFGDYEWTPYCPAVISEWFDNHIFNWLSARSRIVLIYTEPMKFNSVHIDCSPREFGTRQHKFRHVLQGSTDSLYFSTAAGKLYAPKTDNPFIMDGSWPHGLDNNCDKPKLTLALGGPWTGETHYKGNPLLVRSNFEMVENKENYFDPRHEMAWLNKPVK